jgi:hypothetical protein
MGIGRLIDCCVALVLNFCNSLRGDSRLSVHSGLHLGQLGPHGKESLNQGTVVVVQSVTNALLQGRAG